MHTLIVSGSHRPKSQSEKTARFLAERIAALQTGTADVLTLAGNPLPLWDEGVWEGSDAWQRVWAPVSAALRQADALVFVVPEWNGMVPPGFKNFLLLCSDNKELAHKPVLLVSVSAGQGGAYPISELRASGYKNTYPCFLPEHLIVRQVEEVLNAEGPNLARNEDRLRERIDRALRLLDVYGQAFLSIRQAIDIRQIPTGM